VLAPFRMPASPSPLWGKSPSAHAHLNGMHMKLTSFFSSGSISPIVTLVVGQEQRIFAAHENILAASPFFHSVLQNQMMDSQTKKISLPDEEPEVFSSVLEYLYKADYYPRLVHNKKRNSWELEQAGEDGRSEATIYHHSVEGELLKDTAIYCAAEKYGLEELKRISLRKQGLRKPTPLSLYFMPRYFFLTIEQSLASKRAPSWPLPATPTPTPRTPTPSCARITWLSSSAAAAPSSAAAPCNSRCSTAAPSSSLTCLSPCATMSMTSRALRKFDRSSHFATFV